MSNLLQDLRYALRTMIKNPGFTVVVLLALALGIGANTALFSVVNTILLRPLPYEVPEQLVLLRESSEKVPIISVAYPNFLDYKERNQVFEKMVAFRMRGLDLTGVGEPERVTNYQVSFGFFETLGVKPIYGRTFLPEEDQPGSNAAVVLSQSLWERKFNSNPNVIGQTVTLNGIAFSVIGIMPAGFRYPDRADTWTPIGRIVPSLMDRGVHQGLAVLARLKKGVAIEQARANLDIISRQLAEQYRSTNQGISVNVQTLTEVMVRDIRPSLLILLGAVGFVLLIACANVTNLLVARAAARQREIAVRSAMGAWRGRLVRQLLTESLLLALIGGGLGTLLAYWAIKVLKAVTPVNGNIPRVTQIEIDVWVLGFTLLISILTGIIFGLAPALQTSKLNLTDVLKEGGRGQGEGKSQGRIRSILIVVEVALALVVLVGGGLMLKGFHRLVNIDPGFNPESALVMDLALSPTRYPAGDKQLQFYSQLLDRVSSLAGVQASGIVNPLPTSGASNQSSLVPEGVAVSRETVVTSDFLTVSPGYFAAMGIPLLQGRNFNEFDNRQTALVAVIDELTAQHFWPNQSPIGKRVAFEFEERPNTSPTPTYREIIGVVKHVRHNGPLEQSREQVYVSYLQMPTYYRDALPPMSMVIRTSPNYEQGIIPTVRSEVFKMDSNLPLYNISTMEQKISDILARNRLSALLTMTFAAVGLLLAAIGIFGVMSHLVIQRTPEIGVRMALGAQRRDVLKLIVGQGMTLVAIGLAIGVICSLSLNRVLSKLLFAVSATDPITFMAVPLILAAVAFTACYFPARRATKVDPSIALRNE